MASWGGEEIGNSKAPIEHQMELLLWDYAGNEGKDVSLGQSLSREECLGVVIFWQIGQADML